MMASFHYFPLWEFIFFRIQCCDANLVYKSDHPSFYFCAINSWKSYWVRSCKHLKDSGCLCPHCPPDKCPKLWQLFIHGVSVLTRLNTVSYWIFPCGEPCFMCFYWSNGWIFKKPFGSFLKNGLMGNKEGSKESKELQRLEEGCPLVIEKTAENAERTIALQGVRMGASLEGWDLATRPRFQLYLQLFTNLSDITFTLSCSNYKGKAFYFPLKLTKTEKL